MRTHQSSLTDQKNSDLVSPKQRWFIGGFLLFCAAGVVVISRLFLIHNSLRLDEAQSLWQTSHSINGTLKVVAQDVHVPLYHLILHFWQVFFGQGIEGARSLSLVFFIATIPFVYLLARKILSVKWSLFVVFLFSFSPFMNWYANEARMYTLLALMATISQYYFINLVESRGKKGWLGYVLSAVIGIYTHYFFLFNLAAQAIYFFFNRRVFIKGSFKKFAFLAVGLIIELSPWLYYFHSLGSAANTSPNLTRPSTVDFFNAFSQFSFGFQTDANNTILVSTWPILVVVSLLAVKHGQRLTNKVGYIAAAAFVPILLAFGLSYLVSPFFLSRYMIACLPPLTILVVWFVSHYRRSFSLAVSSGFIVLLAIFSLQQYLSPATPVKEDYRAAAEEVNKQADAKDSIVLSAPFTVYPFEYYYHGKAKISTLPEWDRSVPGPIPAFEAAKLPGQVKQLGKNHQYAYVLLSFDQGYENNVFQYYERHYERVEKKKFSHNLSLYIYRVGYNNVKPLDNLQ